MRGKENNIKAKHLLLVSHDSNAIAHEIMTSWDS